MVRHKSRSRSRSRERDRERKQHRDRSRSRSRDRDRKKEKEKDRRHHSHKSKKSRSRSRSPHSSASRRDKPTSSRRDRSSSSSSSTERYGGLTLGGGSVSKSKTAPKKTGVDDKTPIILDPKELEGKSNEEIEMLKIMGFAGFDTTKGKHVDGACNAYAVNIQQKRKYRQYMNRKGGFNKPLDPVA